MDISFLCLNFHAHQAASYIAWISFCERKITYPKYSSAFHSLLPLSLDTMLKGFVCFNIELLYLQTFYNQFEKSRDGNANGRIIGHYFVLTFYITTKMRISK